MKISVCITVKDEDKNITSLLTGLLNQSLKPKEIVIVDGGSSDTTMQILTHFAKKDKIIKILKAPGANIARSRNLGIEVALGEIIATTDAGCIPKKNWLKNITSYFIHDSVGMVAGFYNMPYKSAFNEAVRVYLGVPKEKFDRENFLPSARSVAFRKSVWEEVDGFNEKFEKGGEDTDFFYKCVNKGVKIIRAKEARVEWKEVSTFSINDVIKKFMLYSKGDGEAKIWWHPAKQFSSHNIKISFVYLRYFLGFLFLIYCLFNPIYFSYLLILILLYLCYPLFKWWNIVKSFGAKLYLPIIQIISDIFVMIGFMKGFVKK